MNNNKLRIGESNELLEAFLSNAPFGVVVMDLSGSIIIANKLVSDFLELAVAQNELKNTNFIELVKHISELSDILSTSLANGKKPFSIDSLLFNTKYLIINGQKILDGYMITIENISKQKALETNSIQAILDSLEKERRKIGREIHDGVGPILSLVKLSLDSCADKLSEQNPEISAEALYELSKTIDSVTSDLRSISHRLVPRLLDEFGLTPAFENLIFAINQSKKLIISFYTNIEKDTRIDREIELNIFRCGQELLANAVKYAKTKSIIVQVILHKESIVLMVEDDGIGFEQNIYLKEQFGIGLTNIETRVRVLNGEFNIESSLGKGTVAYIEIPL